SSPAAAMSSIGHFDDTSWSGLDDANGYDDIEVDMTVESAPARNVRDAYFYSNYVAFTGGGTAYAGLQTDGSDGRNWAGKSLIFRVGNGSSGIAERGGTKTRFSGEGTGYSVRMPFDWSLGTTYRFKIYLERGATNNGERLWAASVTDLGSGAETRVGRIS